jgi:salicylate hydroxylase
MSAFFSSSIARICLSSSAVAGLSAAIGLALSGHSVRVLEQRSRLGRPPGGIRLTPNVTKVLVQWGLEDELRKRGTVLREGTHLWNCKFVCTLVIHLAPRRAAPPFFL